MKLLIAGVVNSIAIVTLSFMLLGTAKEVKNLKTQIENADIAYGEFNRQVNTALQNRDRREAEVFSVLGERLGFEAEDTKTHRKYYIVTGDGKLRVGGDVVAIPYVPTGGSNGSYSLQEGINENQSSKSRK